MNKYIFAIISVVIGIIAIGTAVFAVMMQPSSQDEKIESDEKLEVVASFYILEHFARQVGGDTVSVSNLMPVDADPHTYEPSPRDVASVQDADIFLYQGARFNPAAERIADGLSGGVRAVKMTEYFDLLQVNADHAHSGDEHDDEDDSFVDDPHIWLDPVRAQQMIDVITEIFSEVDPENAQEYYANAEQYKKELETLHSELRTALSDCELSSIVVAHNAFSYLADRYGFTIVPISGVSPDLEPSPRRMAEITEIVREQGVDVIFVEPLISPRLSETIARETNTRILELDPIGGLTNEGRDGGDTYLSIQRRNLTHLQEALRCREI